jgi:hypothetical protein
MHACGTPFALYLAMRITPLQRLVFATLLSAPAVALAADTQQSSSTPPHAQDDHASTGLHSFLAEIERPQSQWGQLAGQLAKRLGPGERLNLWYLGTRDAEEHTEEPFGVGTLGFGLGSGSREYYLALDHHGRVVTVRQSIDNDDDEVDPVARPWQPKDLDHHRYDEGAKLSPRALKQQLLRVGLQTAKRDGLEFEPEPKQLAGHLVRSAAFSAAEKQAKLARREASPLRQAVRKLSGALKSAMRSGR